MTSPEGAKGDQFTNDAAAINAAIIKCTRRANGWTACPRCEQSVAIVDLMRHIEEAHPGYVRG